ncbi:hypothetical protein C900_03334 [Fulvivirga imtechensis AK7]|uniref:DUF1579 domain-containing protein n=1 Tax=Fulvivirga imtechensis AK7 TaxID=1237149 RepID=L8JTP7_9BACT|nr:hypothetical protein [Fulvivirga imtechensis]ELR70899.1 hypothetical protein C900_03334 [Fulvivirga imtechensis AK7]
MKTQTLTITLLVLILQGALVCKAQQESNVAAEKMEAFSKLQGKWSGTGWYQQGSQERHLVKQTEHIYSKLDGKILVVEGQGRHPETKEIVFEAFAVLHFDEVQGRYIFNTYTRDKGHTAALAKFEGDDLIWWFETPTGGTIKYTIDFTETTWIEDGHYSPDGEKWYPFFHMELKKL